MSSTLESYELIRFAEAFEARLATAGEMLAGRPGLESEKRWLADALELVRTTRAPSAGVLDHVKDLPELEEAREEYAFHQQGLWVDALEKLHAGITFTASSRAPVIEALFPHVKFAQLRRAPRDAVFEYATSYERRTKSSYVSRIFARDDFALVRPVMEQVSTAHAAWRSSHEPAPLTPEEENVLREELVALGRKLEAALRQARLLSEAAMVPVPSVYEAAGLSLKPKRRAGRGLLPSADEGLAGFGDEPVDSMEPTEAELAEVAALDAGGDEDTEQAAAPAAGPSARAGAAPSEPVDTEDGAAEGGSHDVAEPDEALSAQAGGADTGEDASGLDEARESAADGTAASDEAPARAGAAEGTVSAGDAGSSATPASPASGKAGRGRAAASAPRESPAPSTDDKGVPSEPSMAPGQAPSEPGGEARASRKGRKKTEPAAPPAEAEASTASTEAQAPRVRKKKAAPTPDASGSDTP
ncbi:hypothetical protein ACLESD_25050 [Pyxidicoccus sp. 3LFB2]